MLPTLLMKCASFHVLLWALLITGCPSLRILVISPVFRLDFVGASCSPLALYFSLLLVKKISSFILK